MAEQMEKRPSGAMVSSGGPILITCSLYVLPAFAAAAAAAVSAAKSLAAFFRASFVDFQRPSLKLLAVELFNGALRLRVSAHLHEPEAARLPGVAVRDNVYAFDRPVRLKQSPDGVFGCAEGQIPNKNILHLQSFWSFEKRSFGAGPDLSGASSAPDVTIQKMPSFRKTTPSVCHDSWCRRKSFSASFWRGVNVSSFDLPASCPRCRSPSREYDPLSRTDARLTCSGFHLLQETRGVDRLVNISIHSRGKAAFAIARHGVRGQGHDRRVTARLFFAF